MSATIHAKLKLDLLDKSKIIKGKKHNYYDVTLFINDETRYGNNVTIIDKMSKEDSDNGVKKNYIGEGKVVSVKGNVVRAERDDDSQQSQAVAQEDDLPF